MTDDQIKAHLRHIQDAAYLRDHEAAHIREDDLKMEQVRAQWNNRHSVRSRLEYVLGKLHQSAGAFYAHPELVAELEAILNKIEGAKQ